MLALILVTVLLRLNQICNGQSIEGKPEEEVLGLATEPTGQTAPTERSSVPQMSWTPRPDKIRPLQNIIRGVRVDIGDHWPLGVIPYYFDAASYDELIATRFRDALNSVEESSCVKFKPLPEKPPFGNITWLHVTNPNMERACVHDPAVNIESGEIQVLLGLDCLKRRDVLHTLLHAIGLKDEVGHPHRDQYIRVLWENIQHEYRKLFRVQLGDALTEYDPASIMHFHDRAFTLNGQATITPLMSGLFINPSNDLSPLDKMKLRLLFSRECNRRKVGDLLNTCKNVLHKQQGEEGEEGVDQDKIKSNEEDAPCLPGKQGGCLPLDITAEREKHRFIENEKRDKVEQEDYEDEVAPVTELNADVIKPSAEVGEILD